LDHDITQMYALQTTLSDHLKSYFGLTLAERLRHTPRKRNRWLRLVRLATSHLSSSGHSQQLISIYFPYVEADHSVSSTTAEIGIARTSARALVDTPPVRLQQSTLQSYFSCTTVQPTLAEYSNPGHSSSIATTLPTLQSSPTLPAHSRSLSTPTPMSSHYV
jgi:hypothetical protein